MDEIFSGYFLIEFLYLILKLLLLIFIESLASIDFRLVFLLLVLLFDLGLVSLFEKEFLLHLDRFIFFLHFLFIFVIFDILLTSKLFDSVSEFLLLLHELSQSVLLLEIFSCLSEKLSECHRLGLIDESLQEME